MAWITLTPEKVRGRFTKPEADALLNAAKTEGQTPEFFLDEAIRLITNDVCGSVGACEKNTLGPKGTIPDELEAAALALIRRHLFTRLPGMKNLFDPIRQKEAEDAVRRLERAADCKIAIVPPEMPAEDQPAGPAVQLVSSRPRQFTREKMQGL